MVSIVKLIDWPFLIGDFNTGRGMAIVTTATALVADPKSLFATSQ